MGAVAFHLPPILPSCQYLGCVSDQSGSPLASLAHHQSQILWACAAWTGGQRVKGEGGLLKHPHMCFAQSASSSSPALFPPSIFHAPGSHLPSLFPPGFRGAAPGQGVRVCPHFSSSSSLASGSSSDLSSSLWASGVGGRRGRISA